MIHKFEIRWAESQHGSTDWNIIVDCFERYHDDVPVMLLPCDPPGWSRPPALKPYRAQVFRNVLWLESHLAHHADQLDSEIWLGLCEGVSTENCEIAVSALWHLAELLNDVGKLNPRVATPALAARRAREAAKLPDLDYGSIKGPALSDFRAIVSHIGDPVEEILAAYGDLPESMMICSVSSACATST